MFIPGIREVRGIFPKASRVEITLWNPEPPLGLANVVVRLLTGLWFRLWFRLLAHVLETGIYRCRGPA